MMHNRLPIRRRGESESRSPSEDGYMLLAVICMLALLTISLSVAIPQITKSIQRDQEMETMHRGKQYIRAIQLYYRKFHAYPPSIDALVKTNNIRFLRKRYLDPMTRKDDWKPILFGQNKAPLAMGFFGQPLGGLNGASPLAGTGPGGNNSTTGAGFGTQASSGASSTGDSSGSSFGGSSFGGSSFGGSTGSSLGGSSLFGSSSSGNGNSTTGANSTAATANGTNNSGSSTGGTGSSSTGTGFMSGQTGQSFGGGIIGFEPASPKQSILVYKKKDHYNQWEFTYSPLIEAMQQAGAAGMGGTPNTGLNNTTGAGTSTNSGGSSNTFGGSNSTFGGSNSTFGGSSNTFGGSGSSFGSSSSQPQQ